MPVANLEEARRARAEIRKRGGAVRVRTLEIPGRPDLYAKAYVTRRRGSRRGKTVVIVHKRKGGGGGGGA